MLGFSFVLAYVYVPSWHMKFCLREFFEGSNENFFVQRAFASVSYMELLLVWDHLEPHTVLKFSQTTHVL